MTLIDRIKEAREGVDSELFDAQGGSQAVEDLRFLASRLSYGMLRNVNYYTFDAQGQKLFDVLVASHDLKDPVAKFSSRDLDFDREKLFVALVCYEDEKAKDVYLFPAKEFKKPGMLSMFARDKAKDVCKVKMSNKAKLEQYSFGNVVKTI